MSYGATVSVDNLHRIVYNLRLFQVGKSAKDAVLEVKAVRDGLELHGSIDDNHTYIEDRAAVHGDQPFSMGVSPADLKALELTLRDVKCTFVDLYFGSFLMVNGEGFDPVKFEGVTFGVKGDLDGIMLGDWSVNLDGGPFALYDDRFWKLGRVKPGDYPVDMQRVDHVKYGDLVLFKKGPSVQGALTTIDRDVLMERVDSAEITW